MKRFTYDDFKKRFDGTVMETKEEVELFKYGMETWLAGEARQLGLELNGKLKVCYIYSKPYGDSEKELLPNGFSLYGFLRDRKDSKKSVYIYYSPLEDRYGAFDWDNVIDFSYSEGCSVSDGNRLSESVICGLGFLTSTIEGITNSWTGRCA